MGEARQVMDRVTAALKAGDGSATAECHAEDAVAMTPETGEVKGREAITDYLLQFSEGFPGNRYEHSAKYDDGKVAIDVGYFPGTNTGSLQEPVQPTEMRKGEQSWPVHKLARSTPRTSNGRLPRREST